MTAGPRRVEIAQRLYRAFAAGDRGAIEEILAPEFRFHSPPDPALDRTGYFECCWPHSGNGGEFEFVRTVESGDELIVTYVASRPDGSRFRNTEVLTFDGPQVAEVEVYFGWDL